MLEYVRCCQIMKILSRERGTFFDNISRLLSVKLLIPQLQYPTNVGYPCLSDDYT